MSANNAPANRRPRTKFAVKYGLFKEHQDVARWPDIASYTKGYKSGLTPVSPRRSIDGRHRTRLKRMMHDWQQKRLGHGLPLAYLRAVRAYAPTCEEDSGGSPWPQVDLGNQIHPLLLNWGTMDNFQKDHPPVLTGEGHDGHYLASNPIIAAALHPALQLATRLLDNAHTWAWWDALLASKTAGNKTVFPSSNAETSHLRIKFRSPEQIARESVPIKQLLLDMVNWWQFRIRVGYHDSRYANVTDEPWFGCMSARSVGLPNASMGVINICHSYFKPFLRQNLTESEKTTLHYEMARTILHEIAHAAAFHHQIRNDPRYTDIFSNLSEPFFEDEALNECGHSMEENVFKGQGSAIIVAERDKHIGQPIAMFSRTWPNPLFDKERVPTRECRPERKLYEKMTSIFSPISIEWMRVWQDRAFWNYFVAKFGNPAINPDQSMMRVLKMYVYRSQAIEWSSINLNAFQDDAVEITPQMSNEDRIAAIVLNKIQEMNQRAKDRLRKAKNDHLLDEDAYAMEGLAQSYEQVRQQQQQQIYGQQQPGLPPSLPFTGGPIAGLIAPDPPESVSSYEEQPPEEEHATAEQQDALPRIVTLLTQRRAHLGLNFNKGQFLQGGLLFWADHYARQQNPPFSITPETWLLFLEKCNESKSMLSWDKNSEIIRVIEVGWTSDVAEEQPLAPLIIPMIELSMDAKHRHFQLMRRFFKFRIYLFVSPPSAKYPATSWRDIAMIWFHYLNLPQDYLNPPITPPYISLENFTLIMGRGFSRWWLLGPPGCAQWAGPLMSMESTRSIELFCRNFGWTWDIGKVIKDDDLMKAYNNHVIGVGKFNLAYLPQMIIHWRRLIPEMFWEYFIDISPEGNDEREYRYRFVDKRDGYGQEHWKRIGAEWQGLDVWLREYKKAVKKGMQPDNVWPSDLRLAYNNAMVQIDRSYMCMCPKAFFGGIDYYFPLLCRLLPTGQFLFTLETDVAEDWNDNPNIQILSPADASTINPALLNLGASQSQQFQQP